MNFLAKLRPGVDHPYCYGKLWVRDDALCKGSASIDRPACSFYVDCAEETKTSARTTSSILHQEADS